MLRAPDGGTTRSMIPKSLFSVPPLELSSVVRPDHRPAPMADELGLRNVAVMVDDLRAAVDEPAAGG